MKNNSNIKQRSIMFISIVPGAGRIIGGRVLFQDKDVLKVSEEELRKIRGREIGMVFQEPGEALNPVYTVGYQISEVIQIHKGLPKHEADKEAVRLLGDMGIPKPESFLGNWSQSRSAKKTGP